MPSFINPVNQRTQLAVANRLEVLLFSLGQDSETDREEVFSINVFKVREVVHVPAITRAPDMPEAVEGMVSLRGTIRWSRSSNDATFPTLPPHGTVCPRFGATAATTGPQGLFINLGQKAGLTDAIVQQARTTPGAGAAT